MRSSPAPSGTGQQPATLQAEAPRGDDWRRPRRRLCANIVIAVDLSAAIVGRHVKGGSRRPPSMLEVVAGSINIMQVRVARSRLAGEAADVVIAPRLGQLGLLDYHRAAEAIAEGRETAKAMMPQIRRLLGDMD